MKKYLINLLLIFVFILVIWGSNYGLLLIGQTNYYNHQNNNPVNLVLENENKALKEELTRVLTLNNLDNYNDYDYLKSQILLRDVYNFHETITIKYGKDQNLKKGMAVVNEKGLIGLISKVNQKTSVVKLLTAQDLSVSIKIGESFGALDEYSPSKNYLIAHNFNNYELIMKNEEVYTSGLGLIPEGIFIGQVENSKNTHEQEVLIKSNVDFANLKYIAIIKGIKEL